jgi:PAS domain-containing protein
MDDAPPVTTLTAGPWITMDSEPRGDVQVLASQRRWAALRALSRSLARPLAMPDVLRAMHRELTPLFDTTMCLFGIFDAEAQRVEVVWQIHAGQELPGGSFPLGNGFTSQVIRTGQPRLIRDWSSNGPPVQVQYATDRPGLPQSSITVPVLFDDRVRGVLSVQSYRPDAFDEDDLALLGMVADQVAVAIFGPLRETAGLAEAAAEAEAVLDSMAVGVLVLDGDRRLMRLNQAARQLLCMDEAHVIFGHPVDQPQAGQWPLGTRQLTDHLRPLLERLGHGHSPTYEVDIETAAGQHLACSASILRTQSSAPGGLLLLRPVASAAARAA